MTAESERAFWQKCNEAYASSRFAVPPIDGHERHRRIKKMSRLGATCHTCYQQRLDWMASQLPLTHVGRAGERLKKIEEANR